MKNNFYKLETELLSYDVRRNLNRLNELIADDFIEFGASGNKYDKKIVLELLPDQSEFQFSLYDFKETILAPDTVHVTYRLVKDTVSSFRSSIWQMNNGQWQMIFHQGTNQKTELKQITKDPEDESLNMIVGSWTYNPTEQRVYERIKRHIESEKLYSFSIDGQIIGAVSFKKIDAATSEITGIGVLKEYRNSGYGRQMIQTAEELIRSKTVIVETDDSAVEFYKQCGYTIYKTKTLENGIIRYQLSRRSN